MILEHFWTSFLDVSEGETDETETREGTPRFRGGHRADLIMTREKTFFFEKKEAAPNFLGAMGRKSGVFRPEKHLQKKFSRCKV